MQKWKDLKIKYWRDIVKSNPVISSFLDDRTKQVFSIVIAALILAIAFSVNYYSYLPDEILGLPKKALIPILFFGIILVLLGWIVVEFFRGGE